MREPVQAPKAKLNIIQPELTKIKQPRLWLAALLTICLLVVEVYFLLYDLEIANTSSSTQAEIATISNLNQQVQSKSKNSIIWKDLLLGQKLYNHDYVLTLADSNLSLTFNDGTELTISENSLVNLEQSEHQHDFNQPTKIYLAQGSINKIKTGSKAFAVKLDQNTELVDANGSAKFQVSSSKEGFSINVLNGEVSLKQLNKSVTLAKGQQQNFNLKLEPIELNKKITPPKLKKHRIQYEYDEEARTNHRIKVWLWALTKFVTLIDAKELYKNKATLEFEWEKVNDAKAYQIQISKDQNFSDILVDRTVSDNYFKHKVKLAKTTQKLFYRIASINQNNETSEFSDTINFLVEPQKIKPKKKNKTSKILAQKIITHDSTESPQTFFINLKAGYAFLSRTFKNSSAFPLETIGKGAAYFGELTLEKIIKKPLSLLLKTNALAQQGEPNTENVYFEKYALSVFSFSLGIDHWYLNEHAGTGLYSTTKTNFSWNGRKGVANKSLAFGINNWVHWANASFDLAFLVAGALGVDFSSSYQFKFANHLTTEPQILFRFFNSELTYGGVIKIGYSL